MISNQKLRVSWKPLNPPDCGWKNLYQIVMRTMLQERSELTTTLQFGRLIYSYASSHEDSRSKSSSGRDLTKVRSKSEAIEEARTKGAKVLFASLMDICHLKHAELETKHQKYKRRCVLRGDIVKDCSGSYAVFTEQGSSAHK